MDRREFILDTLLRAGGLATGGLIGVTGISRSVAARPAPSFARTFYVDNGTGDDRNSGTSPYQAWQSLRRVNRANFRPGDRLLFKAGTRYRGQLKPRGSGAVIDGEPQPIVVDRYGKGPRPRIDGEGTVLYAVYLYNTEYWEIKNLEITNTGAMREPDRRGVCVHIEDFGTAHHICLKNLHIHDVNGSLVKERGGGGAILWRNEGEKQKSRFDGLLIENCHLERCARNGINASGYWHRGDWHPSLNVVIRGNLLEGIPGDGIVPIGCEGALVEHNVMRDGPRLLPDGEAAAGIWPWSSDNTIIQFNEVSDHKAPWDAQGFDSDWNCCGTVIQYNYSHDNEGGFLLVCDNGGVTMPSSVGNLGSVVRYNISVNDGLHRPPTRREGKFSPAFHISGPVKDTRIYNNLIAVTQKPGNGGDNTILQMDNWGGPWPEDTFFANNIFFAKGSAVWDWDYGEAVGTRFENNLYYGSYNNAPFERTFGDSESTVRERPLFVNVPAEAPAGIDNLEGFQLQSSSPAIGAGRSVSTNGGRDFWGHPVPHGSRVDIGPHEALRP